MSRKFGIIDSGFWRSHKLKGASDASRLLCLYLIACPHGNSVGMFHLPLAYVQADLGWSEKQVRIQVSELVGRGVLEYDFQHDLVRFVGWWNHNPIDNGKHAAAVARMLEELRCDSQLFVNHINCLAAYAEASGKGYLRRFFTSPDTSADTGGDTGIETGSDILDTDTDTKTHPHFVRETRARASHCAKLEQLTVDDGLLAMAKQEGRDAERELGMFVDACRAKGRRYRDYRAAFRNWLRSPYGKPNGHAPTQAERASKRSSATGTDYLGAMLRGEI